MWIASTGQRLENPLRNSIELHGGQTDTGELVWLEVAGRRVTSSADSRVEPGGNP